MTPNLVTAPRSFSNHSSQVASPSKDRGFLAPVVAVVIEFCEVGNYATPASKLLEALRRQFPGVDFEFDLIPASGGVFEVSVQGRRVFSKRATRRIPDHDEIFYHVSLALGGLCPRQTLPKSGLRGCPKSPMAAPKPEV